MSFLFIFLILGTKEEKRLIMAFSLIEIYVENFYTYLEYLNHHALFQMSEKFYAFFEISFFFFFYVRPTSRGVIFHLGTQGSIPQHVHQTKMRTPLSHKFVGKISHHLGCHSPNQHGCMDSIYNHTTHNLFQAHTALIKLDRP